MCWLRSKRRRHQVPIFETKPSTHLHLPLNVVLLWPWHTHVNITSFRTTQRKASLSGIILTYSIKKSNLPCRSPQNIYCYKWRTNIPKFLREFYCVQYFSCNGKYFHALVHKVLLYSLKWVNHDGDIRTHVTNKIFSSSGWIILNSFCDQ